MSDDFYYGLNVTTATEEYSINVGRYPLRKSYALYVMRPGVSSVVTYLRSREEAEQVASLLEALAKGRFGL